MICWVFVPVVEPDAVVIKVLGTAVAAPAVLAGDQHARLRQRARAPEPHNRASRPEGSCSRTHLAAVAVLVLSAVGLALALAAALLVWEAQV